MHARSYSIVMFLAGVLACLPRVAFAQEQEPAYIVLIDVSGSMNQKPAGWPSTKLVEVKKQLTEFLTNLPTGTEVFVYTFTGKVPNPDKPLVHVHIPEGRDELRRQFQGLNAGGDTAAWDSLRITLGKARSLLLEQPNRRVRVFMFTDGEDSTYSKARSAKTLNDVLSEFDDIIKDKSALRYVKMTFDLGEDVQKVFRDHGVPVIDAVDPDDLIQVEVDFGLTPTRPTIDSNVQFFDRSIGHISEYAWDFGDGGTAKDRTPQHRFQAPGDYAVKLRVRTPAGAWHDSLPKILHVDGRTPLIAKGHTVPIEISLGQPVAFINESEGGATEFEWAFGDGEKSSVEHPAHTYLKPGTYLIKLSVVRGAETDTKEVGSVVVRPPSPPQAAFQFQERGLINESIWFVDSSKGLIDQREWDFGDGSPKVAGGEGKLEHAFTTVGTFTVNLKVNGPGGEHSKSETVRISAPAKPVARFVAGVANPRAGESVRFTDLSEGPVQNVRWDFGDNTAAIESDYSTVDLGQARVVEHAFAEPGTFTVTLNVRGPGGEDSKSETVSILAPAKPVGRFVAGVANPRAGEPVRFTDVSEGAVQKARWDFGDNTGSVESKYTAANPGQTGFIEHTFASAGRYDVTITAEGPGGTSTFTEAISVVPANVPPKAMFIVDVRTGVVPLTVHFENRSEGTITKYVWDFGDGETLEATTPENATHTYIGAGEYRPSLRAEGRDIAPHTYHLEGAVIKAQAPPTMIERYWWVFACAGVAVIGIGVLGAMAIQRRAEFARLRKISGTLRFQPVSAADDPQSKTFQGSRSPVTFDLQHDGRIYSVTLTKTVESPREVPRYDLKIDESGRELLNKRLVPDEALEFGAFMIEYSP